MESGGRSRPLGLGFPSDALLGLGRFQLELQSNGCANTYESALCRIKHAQNVLRTALVNDVPLPASLANSPCAESSSPLLNPSYYSSSSSHNIYGRDKESRFPSTSASTSSSSTSTSQSTSNHADRASSYRSSAPSTGGRSREEVIKVTPVASDLLRRYKERMQSPAYIPSVVQYEMGGGGGTIPAEQSPVPCHARGGIITSSFAPTSTSSPCCENCRPNAGISSCNDRCRDSPSHANTSTSTTASSSSISSTLGGSKTHSFQPVGALRAFGMQLPLDPALHFTDLSFAVLEPRPLTGQFRFSDRTPYTMIHAHRFVFAARSQYFKKQRLPSAPLGSSHFGLGFGHEAGAAVGLAPVISVTDADADSFHELIRFIYTDEITISDKNVDALMLLSHRYAINDLRPLCEEFVWKNMTPANAARFFKLYWNCGAIHEEAIAGFENTSRTGLTPPPATSSASSFSPTTGAYVGIDIAHNEYGNEHKRSSHHLYQHSAVGGIGGGDYASSSTSSQYQQQQQQQQQRAASPPTFMDVEDWVIAAARGQRLVLRFIEEHAAEVLESKTFLSLSEAQVEFLIQLDGLCVREMLVFDACVRWCNDKIIMRTVNVDVPYEHLLRQTMAAFVRHIRFPLMSAHELTTVVVPSKILSNEQVLSVFQFWSLASSNKQQAESAGRLGFRMEFNVQPRLRQMTTSP